MTAIFKWVVNEECCESKSSMSGQARSIAKTLRPESRDINQSNARSQCRDCAFRHGGARSQRRDYALRHGGARSQNRFGRDLATSVSYKPYAQGRVRRARTTPVDRVQNLAESDPKLD